MATTSFVTNLGKNVALYRTWTVNGSLSSTQYLSPTRLKLGVLNTSPVITDTDLDYPIPIQDGTTNDDGDNQLTGSNGGDNSTDNTTTYKQGAGNTDDTAQNLIANGTSATKTWTIANLSTNGTNMASDQPASIWFYIKDATALAKFVSSGTCLEVKFGSDSSNYYSITKEASDLSTGWNLITSNKTNIEDLTETGTVSGDIDTFIIEVTTNNAADTFVAGDVIYDLLRQWEYSDTLQTFVDSYPSIDFTNNEVVIRTLITSMQANGFDINSTALVNQDTSPLMTDEHTYTEESKSRSDEFAYVIRNRYI